MPFGNKICRTRKKLRVALHPFNKQKIPFNLFISGNFDLIKLNMRLDEIQGEKKLKEEDLQYIEQEFNNIVLEEGYVSLFNFLKLKEFFKLITAEDS